ncbi:GTP-binding protein [Kitasatospora sp. NPDC001159]
MWERRRPLHPARFHEALDLVVPAAQRSRGRFWLANRPDLLLGWDAAGASLVPTPRDDAGDSRKGGERGRGLTRIRRPRTPARDGRRGLGRRLPRGAGSRRDVRPVRGVPHRP